jgi:hypothetical protein
MAKPLERPAPNCPECKSRDGKDIPMTATYESWVCEECGHVEFVGE